MENLNTQVNTQGNAPGTPLPDNAAEVKVFGFGTSVTESTSNLLLERQSSNNELKTKDFGSSDITVLGEDKPKLETSAVESALKEVTQEENIPAAVTQVVAADALKEAMLVLQAQESALVALVAQAAGTSVAVIEGSDTENKAFLEKAIASYDKIIDTKTKNMSANRHDRVYSRIFAAVSAILAVASVLILIAAWTVIPVGLLVTLVFIVAVSVMLLSLSALDSAGKTGQVKSSKEQILVARILKKIYDNPSIESEIDRNDEEFLRIHCVINEYLKGSIPAGYIESKELLDTLGNGKATKEDLDRCICRTLSKFIFLRNPCGFIQEKFESSQIYRHLKLLLDNPSLKEELVLALDPKNITMQKIEHLGSSDNSTPPTPIVIG